MDNQINFVFNCMYLEEEVAAWIPETSQIGAPILLGQEAFLGQETLEATPHSGFPTCASPSLCCTGTAFSVFCLPC